MEKVKNFLSIKKNEKLFTKEYETKVDQLDKCCADLQLIVLKGSDDADNELFHLVT